MNEGIMFVIGCGALIGGIDRILGNRLGLGQKFEEGFQLMGATALSMTGIICLAPVLAGLLRHTEKTVSVFSAFASFIQAVATVGLTIGAFQYITGIILFPSIAPLTQAMETVASIAIVMLGSLPLAELFRRVLHRPLAWLGKHTGMNDAAVTGMIVGSITVMPSVVMMKDMNPKGRIMTGAFLVCGAAVIGAHLGFAAGTQPQLITALLSGKLAGALAGMSIALLLSR